ncbi:DUF4232 domain-containing protein [uncultured Jatrophihabitans sp.]|uniref:DUF4232 domain-containing protein n=1 Tax=uncultured Jatrophihabitans sp. TaxID=1610747 RepID=UPI0035C9B700
MSADVPGTVRVLRPGDHVPRCSAQRVSVIAQQRFGGETGETEMPFEVLNIGPACSLRGYPTVAFRDKRGVIPFVAVHGGRYVTGAAPETLLVPKSATARFLVAKYRCDIAVQRQSTTLEVGLPGTARPQAVHTTAQQLIKPVTYCASTSQASESGNVLYVSPIEPDVADTYAR